MRAALALALLLVLAGCSGPQQRYVEAEAAHPASVEEAALSEAGYTTARETTARFETTVAVSVTGDVEVSARPTVNATVFVREYRREGAVVALVSGPAVKPIENFEIVRDPVAALPPEERVALAQDAHELPSLEATGARNVTLLGNETTMQGYEAGTGATVYVGSVRDGPDFVTAVVVLLPGADAERAWRLLGAVAH